MTWEYSNRTAIVGVGATPYYVRGQSWPRTINEMIGEAILNACADAGLSVKDIDGFAYYASAMAGYTDKMDTASIMEMLGIPEVTFTATLSAAAPGAGLSRGE